jgi:flagellar hook-associated protein 1 FlgK
MSLSTALNIAQNSLLNTQRQIGVVSRNIANADNPDYARRSGVLSSLAPGSQVASITRATNASLFKQNIKALSSWMGQSTLMEGLDRLNLSVNGVDNQTSPAILMGELQEALQLYSSTPSNRILAENAIEAARQVVKSLKDGTDTVQQYRADLDSQIGNAVTELNGLLSDFKKVNDEVVAGTLGGRDVLDALDRRDAMLKKISEYVPISTITRPNNDLMLVTEDGSVLFETVPRHVSFDATPAYGPATTGSDIRIDGVPLFKANGANTTAGGTLGAMIQLRDTYATGSQQQLDEVARGLIASFAEVDPGNPANVLAGLFTWTGAPALPADATVETGLAGMISLNALIDPLQGGNPESLRDGANFDYNPDDFASFSDRLISVNSSMDTARDFVAVDGTVSPRSLMDFSTASISWIEDARKTASIASENKSALMIRTAEALSNMTSVNVDEEMALMLQLEQSYSASAKMMQMIDEMLKTLMGIVR